MSARLPPEKTDGKAGLGWSASAHGSVQVIRLKANALRSKRHKRSLKRDPGLEHVAPRESGNMSPCGNSSLEHTGLILTGVIGFSDLLQVRRNGRFGAMAVIYVMVTACGTYKNVCYHSGHRDGFCGCRKGCGCDRIVSLLSATPYLFIRIYVGWKSGTKIYKSFFYIFCTYSVHMETQCNEYRLCDFRLIFIGAFLE